MKRSPVPKTKNHTYQRWHREVDDEVVEWLTENQQATPKQFEDYLRGIYSRPEMRARFPNGY